ncbi:MAG TPA: hypothetical protein VHQ99_05680 [Gaiellaceae bacterium]|jgi:hypothetical protein|nr:hypothetical protein [Gaiellaceae bacterium]
MATLAHLVLSLAAALALVGHPATRIPAGVRSIDVHVSRGPSREVTDRAKVAKIVRWFDALPTAPRVGIYHCPLIRSRPPVTLHFRAANGIVLAHARTPGHAACGFSFDYSVLGSRQKPVLARRFLVRVGRLLGMRLVPHHR